MTAALTILYEDARGEANRFGLHALVKACVFDAIDGERHRVEAALRDARPLKGVQNVLKACRQDFDLIAGDGRSVVAVIDNDAIRQHLKLSRHADRAQVEREIKKGCVAPERLFVILIEQNTESVLVAAAACDPGLDADRVERAAQHKDLLERDAIFAELSRERARSVRECVLGRMPSLRALVELLCRMLLPGAPNEAPPAPPAPGREKRRRAR